MVSIILDPCQIWSVCVTASRSFCSWYSAGGSSCRPSTLSSFLTSGPDGVSERQQHRVLCGSVFHHLVPVLCQPSSSLQRPAQGLSQHALPGPGCLSAQQVNVILKCFRFPFLCGGWSFKDISDCCYKNTNQVPDVWVLWWWCVNILPLVWNYLISQCKTNKTNPHSSVWLLLASPQGLGRWQCPTSSCSRALNPWLASTTQTERWRRSGPSSVTRQVQMVQRPRL